MEMDSPTFFVGVRDNKILMKELHGQINYIIEVDPVSGSKETVMQYNGGRILPFEYDNQLYMLVLKDTAFIKMTRLTIRWLLLSLTAVIHFPGSEF